MKVRLKKDIVIPAGTVFDTAPSVTNRSGPGHVVYDIGLTPNTSGTIAYFVGPPDSQEAEELSGWFEPV